MTMTKPEKKEIVAELVNGSVIGGTPAERVGRGGRSKEAWFWVDDEVQIVGPTGYVIRMSREDYDSMCLLGVVPDRDPNDDPLGYIP